MQICSFCSMDKIEIIKKDKSYLYVCLKCGTYMIKEMDEIEISKKRKLSDIYNKCLIVNKHEVVNQQDD